MKKPIERVVLISSVALFLGSFVTEAGAEGYFPLQKGNYWEYSSGVRWAVKGRIGDEIKFAVRETTYLLLDRGKEVHIKLREGEDFGLFCRFEKESKWNRRHWFSCDDNSGAMVERKTETVTVPAGTFENCLVISYVPLCMDAGIQKEWWAPGVGLVKWEQSSIMGPVKVELTEYCVRGSGCLYNYFKRGDVNADSGIDIADAVYFLYYLFSDGSTPACLDAADANNDGSLNISDPVAILGYLFAGKGPLPDPFSGCGPDTGGVSLGCESFAPCNASCSQAVEAIAKESSVVGSCCAAVRLDYNSRDIVGWHLSCKPYHLRNDLKGDPDYCELGKDISAEKAKDLKVYYDSPGDFGGACVYDSVMKSRAFNASIIWYGTGKIFSPEKWRPAASIGIDCNLDARRPPFVAGYDLRNGTVLGNDDIEAVVSVVWRTALPRGLLTGQYLSEAAVLLYPRTVGAFDPRNAEWIVILTSRWLE